MFLMTVFYTTILLYMIPKLQLKPFLNNISTIVEKSKKEGFLPVSLLNSQKKTSRAELKTKATETMQIENKSIPTYYIKATLDEKNYQINGQVNITIDNPGTNSILFYTYSYSWAPMKIRKVLLNDQEVPFSYDKKQLSIKNPKEEKKLAFSIEFETPVPRKGTRFGYKDDIWLITTWYPMLGVLDKNQNWINRPNPIGMGDPFVFNFANYIVEWTSSPSINWLSSGVSLSESVVNNKRKSIWKVENVRNFALAGSKNYKIKRLQLNKKTTVSIALIDDKNFDQIIKITKASFALFDAIYGQLPYSNLSVIETGNNTNFALEYPNFAVFSKDLFSDNQIEHWLPHEIGHMWWYNAVGVNEVQNGWIDEGLAELGVVLYLENQYSKSKGGELRNTYRKRNQLLINTTPKQTMNTGLYGFKSRTEFYDSWYARSADMFLTLREKIGKDKFNYFLKTLYQTNIGKTIDEESITRALDESLAVETNLFKNWINEPYQRTQWDVNITNSSTK